MDAARYARAKELFEQALRLSTEARGEFVLRECGDDADLAREVTELLRHHDSAPEFLDGNAGDTLVEPERPAPTMRVAGYRIERELGRGGMGVVYLAMQDQPRRAVALKFLRLDSLSPAEVARFQREPEILGRLRHPGIAHVYGAGLAESEQGRIPWIAMEYVSGEPLRRYVESRALELRDLVALVLELSLAVQHAHERGIVHRDLKPSNVLVDERGHVHVLDFGVARLIGDGAADAPLVAGAHRTRTGTMVGTLAYASPEQVTGAVSTVSARSDVYALGVILHELLTGTLPYAIDESRVVEAIHTICEEEPRRLRKQRSDAPADLETVLLKALEKEPARRYADAGELAADLRRVLEQRPVTARAPSALYQLHKFVRRNRAVTLSATAVILALTTAVVVLLLSQRRVRDQFARRGAMLDQMTSLVFGLVPELGFGQTHRGTLEELDASLAGELELAPEDRPLRRYRARSQYELAGLDMSAGDYADADQRLAEAWRLREQLVAEDPEDLDSLTNLSQIFARLGERAHQNGDPAGERAWIMRAYELDLQLVSEHPGMGELVEDLGWSLERLTDLAMRAGDWDEAERLARLRLSDATRLVEEDDGNWKYLKNAAQAHVLAASVAQTLHPDEVLGHQREFQRLAQRLHDLQPRRADFLHLWATASHQLARLLIDTGSAGEALPYAESTVAMALQLLSSDHANWHYADFLRDSGQILFHTQLELGSHEQSRWTLGRLRLGASIPGDKSPSKWLLLAAADALAADLETTPEGKAEMRERSLTDYVRLFLLPDIGKDLMDNLASRIPPELAAEICRRIEPVDERAAERVRVRFGLEDVPSEAR
jgi:serine/threonine protein kinase